jgi:hypothetical protein
MKDGAKLGESRPRRKRPRGKAKPAGAEARRRRRERRPAGAGLREAAQKPVWIENAARLARRSPGRMSPL